MQMPKSILKKPNLDQKNNDDNAENSPVQENPEVPKTPRSRRGSLAPAAPAPQITPQQITVVLDRGDRKSHHPRDENVPQEEHSRVDCMSKFLNGLRYMLVFLFFLGSGIALLVWSQDDSCQGTPGLLQYIEAEGVMCIVYSFYQILDFYYFRKHQNQTSGQCFSFITDATVFVAACVSGFGLVELLEQTQNDAAVSLDTINGPGAGSGAGPSGNSSSTGTGSVSCDSSCELRYSCSTVVYYSSIFLVLLSIVYFIIRVRRLKIWCSNGCQSQANVVDANGNLNFRGSDVS